eukprot:TRINITY_DN8460_c0_g2_i1.p1 TRINITY_DN8460_c0_g2~~TRINITY_DN8460_c0_g2_i1.p1  ORF type:complete len:319 (+),score=117.25 TRINITY_DN8460_c0_g2_i1:59-1015(+)
MKPLERFLFDLNGYIIVRGALSAAEVDGMNACIDRHAGAARARAAEIANVKEKASRFAAEKARVDMGGMLGWEDGGGFRSLLAHPKLVPYLHALVGEGYRMDHQPMVLLQEKASEGFSLHGGPLVPSRPGAAGPTAELDPGHLCPELQYRCTNGQMWNSLVAMSVALCDTDAGDGGFCVVKGSHKLNFAMPPEFSEFGGDGEDVHQPVTKKGDVIFFSEATVHGALPWNSDVQRRVALYRFAPGIIGYGRGHLCGDYYSTQVLPKCTAAEAAVLQPAFSNRLERTLVEVKDGEVAARTDARNAAKKAHDEACFGVPYF